MRIYFSGIGGVGIGPLAMIAKDAGFDVFGSDRENGLITKKLEEKNIKFTLDQSGKTLKREHENKPFDWLVYTAAMPLTHPELQFAKENNIRISKRDEFLSFLIKEKNLKLIAVSGTHGKTTTTGMIIWLFNKLNIPLSYSIGTTINFGPSGKFDQDSKYFAYECDEFDRNMLHFNPYLSLITNVGYDHSDTYSTEKDYVDAFKEFIIKSKHSVVWGEDSNIIPESDEENSLVLDKNNVSSNLKLPGIHNRLNSSLAIEGLKKYIPEFKNIDNDNLIAAINSFPGTDRRFEKIAENIYTDYGHHPEEISATLQMANEISDNVVLVYQPHQNVRQHEIKNQYTDCMNMAKKIYWLPTYLTREDESLEILTPEELTKNLENKNFEIEDMSQNLIEKIKSDLQKNNLVLFMGAGTIDSWARKNFKK